MHISNERLPVGINVEVFILLSLHVCINLHFKFLKYGVNQRSV